MAKAKTTETSAETLTVSPDKSADTITPAAEAPIVAETPTVSPDKSADMKAPAPILVVQPSASDAPPPSPVVLSSARVRKAPEEEDGSSYESSDRFRPTHRVSTGDSVYLVMLVGPQTDGRQPAPTHEELGTGQGPEDVSLWRKADGTWELDGKPIETVWKL